MSFCRTRAPSVEALADAPVYFRYTAPKVHRVLVDSFTAGAVLAVYRGCNSRRVVVEATSTDEALDLAHEIVRRRRGVIRIDGGTIDGRPAPPK